MKKKNIKIFFIILILIFSFFILFNQLYANGIEYLFTKNGEFSAKIMPDTSWVESRYHIYFFAYDKLGHVNIDGTNLKYIFESKDTIPGKFLFSPDANYLLFENSQWNSRAYASALYLVDINSDKVGLIDSTTLKENQSSGIDDISWAPDSKRFLYIKYNSPLFGLLGESQYKLYLYDIIKREKKLIETPYKPEDIFWDPQGESFYFTDIKGTMLTPPSQMLNRKFVYKFKLFRVSLIDLKPKLIKEFDDQSSSRLGKEQLESSGAIRFSQDYQTVHPMKYSSVSERGEKIEKEFALFHLWGYLNYINAQGNKKRLFKLRTKLSWDKDGLSLYLDASGFTWAPGGRYVILVSNKEIAILEPATGKLGKLVEGKSIDLYDNLKK